MRHQESLTSTPKSALAVDGLGGVALFFDLENILLGVQGKFVVDKVVEFLAERGEVMILRAYADWGRYRNEQRQFLEGGVQMVFLPSFGINDKNRTDTAICVDAMEILFTRPHIDTFAIVSGDSDFGVLAQRLRDHGKRVVGISAKSAASQILVKQCHEFVFYETLVGQRVQGYSAEEGEARLRKALDKVVEDYGSEFRASVLKDFMRKQDPAFSERNYGAASFTQFLRGYDRVLTLLDGGLVRVGADREDEAVAAAPAPAAPRRSPAGPPPKAPNPTLAPEDEARARDALVRAFSHAASRRMPVRMSRLKDALQFVAPEFDEAALGFRTFTRFLKAFPDVVSLERDDDTVTAMFALPAAEGAAPAEVEGAAEAERRGADDGGRRRGSRSRGGRKRSGEGRSRGRGDGDDGWGDEAPEAREPFEAGEAEDAEDDAVAAEAVAAGPPPVDEAVAAGPSPADEEVAAVDADAGAVVPSAAELTALSPSEEAAVGEAVAPAEGDAGGPAGARGGRRRGGSRGRGPVQAEAQKSEAAAVDAGRSDDAAGEGARGKGARGGRARGKGAQGDTAREQGAPAPKPPRSGKPAADAPQGDAPSAKGAKGGADPEPAAAKGRGRGRGAKPEPEAAAAASSDGAGGGRKRGGERSRGGRRAGGPAAD